MTAPNPTELARENEILRAENDSLRATHDRLAAAFDEWIEKTDWVQQTVQVHELGKHRADVLRGRITELEAKLAARP